jgi:hypothetical protein
MEEEDLKNMFHNIFTPPQSFAMGDLFGKTDLFHDF